MTSNFDTLTVAYDDLDATIVRLGQYNSHIKQDFNSKDDKFFYSPLEYGPRNAVKSALHDCKGEFIKFIIQQMSKSDRCKNLIIDEDTILKLFGIGYGSVEKYGSGFKAQDVVDCFIELYDRDDMESVVYQQILKIARHTRPWHFSEKNTEIKRFGKDNSGIILRHYDGYTGNKDNPTTELIKLLFITYEGVSSLSAKNIEVDAGDTLKNSDLPFCESLKAFKNGNLKIKFRSTKRADEVCKLLLGD